MKCKLILLIFSLIFICKSADCQTKAVKVESEKIKRTITNFLYWYKVEQGDTTSSYPIFKGGYPDTATKPSIDMAGVEIYLTHFRRTGYFSEAYLNSLKEYYQSVATELKNATKSNALVKMPGFDGDLILSTFEPEMILDHIKEGRFDKMAIIYDKAIVRFKISKVVQMLFTLTKRDDKWMIDYIGYDTSYIYSVARK